VLYERNLLYILSDPIQSLSEHHPANLRLLPRYASRCRQQLQEQLASLQYIALILCSKGASLL
jgi:hypothetical protein